VHAACCVLIPFNNIFGCNKMSKKNTFDLAVKLIECMETFKTLDTIQEEDLVNVYAHLSSFEESIPSHERSIIFKELEALKLCITTESKKPFREYVYEILQKLNIQTPDMIFLLTAPFDEDAKTGDGQYALSLVEGFKKHAPSTQCTWLKLNDGHYQIFSPVGLKPIPEKTIPSVYVLQPVANGRTTISGYQCMPEYLESAKKIISQKISLRTPQILTDEKGVVSYIGFQGSQGPIIFNAQDVKKRIDLVTQEMSLLLKRNSSSELVIVQSTLNQPSHRNCL
jgi:hypothetical protein